MPVLETKGAISAQGFGLTLGSAEAVYIEDVFSTWLYTGAGPSSGVSVNNGIDLLGKGGMVWTKPRSTASSHAIFDTLRGVNNYIMSNQTLAQNGLGSASNLLTSFNSNGFTLGTDSSLGLVNASPFTYVSWTFREQPKFFDVVTYTGDGSGGGQAISHNLGSTPGFVIVKRLSSGTTDQSTWWCWHRTFNTGQRIALNSANAATSTNGQNYFGNGSIAIDPTATTVQIGPVLNSSAVGYVMYLYAHNAGGFGLSGTDNVVTCGFWAGTGGQVSVNLGYEPQWLLFKRTDASGFWTIYDNMRGVPTGGGTAQLWPNSADAEDSATNQIDFNATGFTIKNTGALSVNGGVWMYIAIRRGPMKTPTTGTSVYHAQATQDVNNQITTGFPVDMVIDRWAYWDDSQVAQTGSFYVYDRLRGSPQNLVTNSTAAETSSQPSFFVTTTGFQSNTQLGIGPANGTLNNWYAFFWSFRRAPSFFDVSCYTGTGVYGRTVNHNLGVVPELIIVKQRSLPRGWAVYSAAIGNTRVLQLNTDAGQSTDDWFANTTPTSTVFSVGSNQIVNENTQAFVAYLFASCPGVSKVGSYTGTGATQVINCGFTGGARFVLIKATSTTGDWYVWDSSRGIVAANDPYLRFNSTAAQVTNTDWVDTAATGFELSNAGGNLANSNGVSYIFLAIS